MKYIKSINEHWSNRIGWTSNPFISEETKEFNKIARSFIKRLEKVKGENNPYEINIEENITASLIRNGVIRYSIQFDDVLLKIEQKTIRGFRESSFKYKFYLDDELIECWKMYSGGIFQEVERILKEENKKEKRKESLRKKLEDQEKIKRLKYNINTAADLLDKNE